jgi:hypothetical protein
MAAHPYVKLPSLTSPIGSVDAPSAKALSLLEKSKKKGKPKASAAGHEPSTSQASEATLASQATAKTAKPKGSKPEPAALSATRVPMEACRSLSPAALSLLSTPLPTGPTGVRLAAAHCADVKQGCVCREYH